MRKIYFLLLTIFSFLASTKNSFSQTITIGTGTSVQRFPLNYYYGYGRSSMIYTAAEMGTTGTAASVLSIAFECNTALNTGPTVIYLQEAGTATTQTATTWAAKISAATAVYNGTPAVGVAGWRTITLTTPFPLSANQNLEVMIECNVGGTGTGGNTGNDVRYSDATDAHQFWQQDNTPPTGNGAITSNRPNIQMVLGPPIACVTPPGGGTTKSSSVSVCPDAGFTLSVTGASFGTGLTYQWESSADDIAWDPIAGASSATLNTNTIANTYYRRKITCGGMDAYSTSLLITVSAPLSIPFTENFSGYAATFPPACWTNNDAALLTGVASSAFGLGSGSARFNFYDASGGTILDLTTAVFTPVPVNYRLTFNHAYATFSGEVDQLEILYSANGGASYTSLIIYDGGIGGPLNTGGTDADPFSPTAAQWASKEIALPVGTNRLIFRGISDFGNNLFIDNVMIEEIPPCLPPTGLTVSALTQTTAIFNWNASVSSPSNGYQWEVRTSGAGGSGAAGLVATGNTAAGITTANVTGLTANTTYSLYARSDCGSSIISNWTDVFTFTTLCDPANVPYIQNFDAAAPPDYPSCLSLQDLNGATTWKMWYFGGTVASSVPNSIRYEWNSTTAADDWFFIRGLNLTGGKTYTLRFKYKGSDGPDFIEKLEVKYGTAPIFSAMTSGTLFTNTNITSSTVSPFAEPSVAFTPAATGVYYIGFHAFSDADQAFLYVDDINVELTPIVDVGITGIVIPSLACPATGVIVQATMKNYNLFAIDFSVHPVTVTANITGATTASLTATLNSGTLTAGDSMKVDLSPAFDFPAGTYNITVATSSPDDAETANDSYTTLIKVNPVPVTPAITPSATQLCIGNTAQLSTQFTDPPPPPVNHPAVSSGDISLPVPDNNPAGLLHILAVNGIPANATVTAISVTINATHTWNSDLIFNLKAPNGHILNLINAKGGSGDGFTDAIISSASGNPLPSGNTTPVTGTFAANGVNGVGPAGYVSDVASFTGLYSIGNGNWTLAVRDRAPSDIGTLTSWSIAITYQVLHPVVSWSPLTGLFTNAPATTAYTGGNAYSVYARPDITTTYTATATGPGGCTGIRTATVTVNLYPVIITGAIPDTVCISDPLVPLVTTPAGGSWSGIGVSGNNFVPPATATGAYTLTYSYTNDGGCTSTATKKIAVKDCPERIILLRDNAVILYPNPNDGRFNIRINSVLYNYLAMKVFTNDGVLVRTQQLGGLAYGRVIPIDISNLPGGVYMVKFYYDGGVRTSEKTFKVIIGR